jgi:hypothetical protein
MDKELTPEDKAIIERIKGMSQMEMAQLWRFAPPGHSYFDVTLPFWPYFEARFKEVGGWTPGVSKAIGLGD